ncbi:MAG TPA: NAD(P)/FAD-dependent oxidoreductase [Longimicrobiales bacterium]|nr:NAD(P)/FAD-dependent oxidoreductase [Longimicrobiales bacterium]
MTDAELKDITIIGGGPTGLFAAFYAGMRGVSARIIDSLPELGGQLTALYPEKYIYDVGGFSRILARDLARSLIEQGTQFGADVRLEEEVRELVRENGSLVVTTDRGRYPTRAVLIAAGKGAFSARKLECPGYDELLGKGVAYHVKDVFQYEGKRVLVVGGGDSAVDWVLHLKDLTKRLVLIHRREGFRAHAHTMKLMHDAVAKGEMELLTHKEVRIIEGDSCVRSVTIFDNRTNEELTFEMDAVIALIGFKPDLGAIASWGLQFEKHSIVVNQRMETNLPGVYAAGDIAAYEGKLELIATGFSEACMAVNHAVQAINPKARYNPGHSTNLKLFKDREEAEAAAEAAGQ